MRQVKKIMLTRISLYGFKGIQEARSFEFGSTTLIEADNGQGKSSILEAVVYVFTGCTFWGDNKNERLMNNNSKTMQVDAYFSDENGTAHALIRRKTYSGTTITFDGIPVRQTDLIEVFGEKDSILSIVNPLYFIEQMADSSGRDFLLKLLPVISHEDVMLALGEYHRNLLAGENIPDPATYIKNCRAKIREMEDSKTYTQGKIDMLSKKILKNLPAPENLEARLAVYQAQLQEIESNKPKPTDAAILEGKKLALEAELDSAMQSQPELKDCAPVEIRLVELKGQQSVLKSRQYVSGITGLLTGLDLKLNSLRLEWTRLGNLTNSISTGSTCPTCLYKISSEHIAHVKAEMSREKSALKAAAEPLVKRREWLLSQDSESQKNFETRLSEDLKACEDEMARLELELQSIKSENNSIIKNFSDKKELQVRRLRGKIAEHKQQITSLKADFQNQLLAYEKTVTSQKTELLKEIEDLQAQKHSKADAESSSQEILQLTETMNSMQNTIDALNRKINAAVEYAAKRADLALKPLKMNRVEIKLQEVVKSTGEIVNTFRFTFDGRDYRILSLSERLRAGLEVSNLIQQLAGRCYPVLIDNSESIMGIKNLSISGQAILSRVVPGTKLSIKTLAPMQESNLPPLKKAG